MSVEVPNEVFRMVLDAELAYFDKHRDEWLKVYKGQVALVKGATFHGTFTTTLQAFEAGVNLFGTSPFLVKEIEDADAVIQYPSFSIGMLSAHP